MPKFPQLSAAKRDLMGRKVKQLRRQGLIPANLFGKKIDSIAVQVDAKHFNKIYDQVGETGIVDVAVGDKSYPCLIVGRANDPVTGSILHVDFHNVSLKEKVTATIPVELAGEAPAVKDLGGVVNQSLYELEVEALPTDLPEVFKLDVSKLVAIGDNLAIKDLAVPEGVTVELEPETIIVSIAEPAPEEVVEEAPADAETEAPAEGEAPAKAEAGAETPAADESQS
jgi:large subunit ribosomal protein L25